MKIFQDGLAAEGEIGKKIVKELGARSHVLEKTQEMLRALQAESASKEATIQRITTQINELVHENQRQTQRIQTLERQNMSLISRVKSLITELMSSSQSAANSTTDKSTPSLGLFK